MRFPVRTSPRARKILLGTVVLCVLAGGWTVWQALSMGRATAAQVFDDVGRVPPNRVALVLGCSPRMADGSENRFFTHRVDAAAALYRAGKAEYLLVSGDNGRKDYDEPAYFRDALVARGVPAERIVLDYAGFRTLDSVVRAREVFGQASFTVVSQRFHNERAVFLAREVGIRAVGFNARDVEGSAGTWTRAREVLARVKAVLDVRVLGTGPRYLGDPVPIGTPASAAATIPLPAPR